MGRIRTTKISPCEWEFECPYCDKTYHSLDKKDSLGLYWCNKCQHQFKIIDKEVQ